LFFILAILCVLIGRAAGGELDHSSPLGSWLFRHGDDQQWATMEQEDSSWEVQTAPELFEPSGPSQLGWYRLHFDLPAERPDGGWGLWLGRILTADEVYLNGSFIGGEGRIGEDFVDSLQKERVYLLPDPLLASTGNVLAVRTQTSLGQGGLADVPRLGAWREFYTEASRRAARQKGREAFVLGMLLMTLCFWGLLFVRTSPHHGYGWIGVVMILITTVFGLESLLFYDAGLLTPGIQRLAIAAMILLPVPLFMLCLPVIDHTLATSALKGLAALCCGLAALNLLLGGLELCGNIEPVWLLVLLLGAGIILYGFTQKGWHALSAPALAVFAGFFWLAAFALAEYLISTMAPHRLPFSLALHLGFAGLTVSLAIALSLQYHATYRKLRLLSRKLVGTEEEERKRLAATLHNDIAPALATVKLDLQLIFRKFDHPPEGPRTITDLSSVINALRDFSHTLRPAAVDQLGLCVALRSLAERIAEHHHLTLALELPQDRSVLDGMSSDTAISLYRATQEALNNTARHAQARKLIISLTEKNKGLLLHIADDGQGFETNQAYGLGLLTLRERAEAMAGSCCITTAPGKGVKIELWLPLQ